MNITVATSALVLLACPACGANAALDEHNIITAPSPARTVGTNVIDELVEKTFAFYVPHDPEDSSSLGISEQAAHLKDLSPSAIAEEIRFYRALLGEVEAASDEELSIDQTIALDHVRRLCLYKLHFFEEQRVHLFNVGASAYPVNILHYDIARAAGAEDWARIASRVHAIPKYLSQQEGNLRTGVAEGLTPDRAITETILESMGKAVGFLRDDLGSKAGAAGLGADDVAALHRAGTAAAGAYAAHAAFLRQQVMPHVGDSFAIGADEYRWRLRTYFGIDTPLDELVARAEAELKALQAEMVATARAIAGDRIADLKDAHDLLTKLREDTAVTDENAVAMYIAVTKELERIVRESKLFELQTDYILIIQESPPGMSVARAFNWPAPLLDPKKGGVFCVTLGSSHAKHNAVDAWWISAHEGIPGHYLQSLAWQRRFGRSVAPLAFFLVADDVNIAAGPGANWSSNLMVEGFALYVERLLQPYLTAEQQLAALSGQALRAARVIVDIGLHTGEMTRAQVAEYLERNALLPAEDARAEALRYSMLPTQAASYLIGCQGIVKLKDEFRERAGARFSEARFHEALFEAGPTSPALAREIVLRRADRN